MFVCMGVCMFFLISLILFVFSQMLYCYSVVPRFSERICLYIFVCLMWIFAYIRMWIFAYIRMIFESKTGN